MKETNEHVIIHVCPQCGATVASNAVCEACFPPAREERPEPKENTPIEEKSEKTEPHPTNKKPILLLAAALAGIILLGFIAYKTFLEKNTPILFEKDNHLMLVEASRVQKQKTLINNWLDSETAEEPFAWGYRGQTFPQASEDEKTLFFGKTHFAKDETEFYTHTTYYRYNRTNGKQAKIDDQVSTNYLNKIKISADGSKIFYVKKEENTLIYNNGQTKTEIDQGVWHFLINKTGDHLIYQKSDQIYEWSSQNGKQLLADHVTEILNASKNLKTIYYQQNEELFIKTQNQKSQKIDEDIREILAIQETGQFYYSKTSEKRPTYETLVTDKLKKADQTLTQAASSEKRLRDELRTNLTQEIGNFLIDLYYYNGKSSQLIATEISEIALISEETPILIYRKPTTIDIPKVDVAQLSSIHELDYHIQSSLKKNSEAYLALGGTTSKIETTDHPTAFSLCDDTIYFFTNVDSPERLYIAQENYNYLSDANYAQKEYNYLGNLNRIQIKNQQLSNLEKIDSNVESQRFINTGKNFFYFKDETDLYEEGEKIASSIFKDSFRTDKDRTTYYFLSDHSIYEGTGTLSQLRNGKVKELVKNVHDFTINGIEEEIIYLKNYDPLTRKGTAYLYNQNGKPKQISTEISGLVSYTRFTTE